MKENVISPVERKILSSLNQNGRKSFRQVAKEVSVSTTAIYNTIKKLGKNKVIKGYIPVIDMEYMGFDLIAIIELRVNQGKDREVQEAISQFPQVRAVFKITGEWDYILICFFEGLKALDNFLVNKLSMP